MKKVKLMLIGLFAAVLLPSAAQQVPKLPADAPYVRANSPTD